MHRLAKMPLAKGAIPLSKAMIKARSIKYFSGAFSRPNFLRNVFDPDYLTADTNHALIDQQVKIKVQNLNKGQKVTLRTVYDNSDQGKSGLFQSFAHYEVGKDGCIDLARSPSLGGTYEGIEPMGPFWSMAPVLNGLISKDKGAQTRILIRDPSPPLQFKLSIYQGFIDFNSPETIDAVRRYLVGQELDSMCVYRWYKALGYVSEEIVNHGHDRLRGSLYTPKSDGKLKAIIDLNGVGAGHQPARAALLASHGYAVYAISYNSGNVHIEDFEKAVEWLLNHPKVDRNGIGILARCVGSVIGMILASNSRVMDKIKSIVCINPIDCPAVFPIYTKGQPSSYLPFIMKNMRSTQEGHGMTRYCFDSNKREQEAGRVPVENMIANSLLLAGQDDKSVPADVRAQNIQAMLVKHGKGDQCELVLYPKTGHLIEPPFMPMCSHSYVEEFKRVCAWGGESKYHAYAQEDSWERIIEFFSKTL